MPYARPQRPRYTPRRYGMGTRALSRFSNRVFSPSVARPLFRAASMARGASLAGAAGYAAYRGYRYLANRKKANGTPMRSNKKVMYKKAKPQKAGPLSSKAKEYGVVLSNENYKFVTDNEIVYIGHASFPINLVVRAITLAILRKIVKRGCGFDATDITQEIPTTEYNNALGGKIAFIFKNSHSDALYVVEHTLANNDSLNTVADTFYALISAYLTEGHVTETPAIGPSVQYDVFERVMFRVDPNGAFRTLADMNMNLELIRISCTSTLKMQNNSLSAGGSNSTDVNNVNPVEGYKVGFSSGVPIFKSQHTQLQDFRVKNSGICYVQGSQLHVHEKEPKTKLDFVNAKYHQKIKVAPGSILTSKIHSTHNHFIRTLNKKCRPNYIDATSTPVIASMTALPGKYELFSFEETINRGGTLAVTMAFEQQQYVSAYLTTKAKAAICTYHTQAEV